MVQRESDTLIVLRDDNVGHTGKGRTWSRSMHQENGHGGLRPSPYLTSDGRKANDRCKPHYMA